MERWFEHEDSSVLPGFAAMFPGNCSLGKLLFELRGKSPRRRQILRAVRHKVRHRRNCAAKGSTTFYSSEDQEDSRHGSRHPDGAKGHPIHRADKIPEHQRPASFSGSCFFIADIVGEQARIWSRDGPFRPELLMGWVTLDELEKRSTFRRSGTVYTIEPSIQSNAGHKPHHNRGK